MAITLHPLDDIPVEPHIAALPKADIHLHGEMFARLDRVIAKREGRPPYDYRQWIAEIMQHEPGKARLRHISTVQPVPESHDAEPGVTVARIEDILEDAAANGAILAEVRFGNMVMRPDFIEIFREAEQRVQGRHPHFIAEPIAMISMWREPERQEQEVEAAIRHGLFGVDILPAPYETEADWTTVYRLGERLVEAGLRVTAHVGEIATANIAAALKMPGLTRIGHGTYAYRIPGMLEQLAERQITVECCLSVNAVMGAVPSYADHPLRQMVDAGVPIALCTDNPVQLNTSIAREYQIAHLTGLTEAELLDMTRNAINAAFTSNARRNTLLAQIDS